LRSGWPMALQTGKLMATLLVLQTELLWEKL